MAKKIIAWLLVVVMTASICVAGTLAYLTDRDSEANVFTAGNVDISLKEDFNDGSTLIPDVEINKDVQIKNEGPNAAYVWYTYAIPQALDGNVEMIYANEVKASTAEEIQAALADDAPFSDVKIVLTEDIVIDKNTPWDYTSNNGAHFEIHKYKNVVLDMNGHKITVMEDALKDGKTYANALFLIRNASFTLMGDGEIDVRNHSTVINCWQDSTQTHSVKVYGNVKMNTNATEIRNESTLYVQAVKDENNNPFKEKLIEVYLYGGTYDSYGLNVSDGCKNNTVLYLYEGVRFSDYQFDLFMSDRNAGRIQLGEGCSLEYADGWYTVVGPKEQGEFKGFNNVNWLNGQLVGTVEKNGVVYNVYSRLYKEVLQPGETTTMDLTAVMLEEYVDITPDGQLYKVLNGETTDLNWNINGGENPVVFVNAYAIQAEGMEDVYAAYNAFVGQWGNLANAGTYVIDALTDNG